jgi:hypothetical protein
MKTRKRYQEAGTGLVLTGNLIIRWPSASISTGVETEDGAVFTLDRLAFPERTGKIRNLVKSTRAGELIWSIEPRIPELSPDEYDYFTWVRVHDDAKNLVEAYTSSGYKLILDADSGEVKEILKDRIFRLLEVKDRVVFKNDGTPLNLHGKSAVRAIEVDDGIIVLIWPGCYPELDESEKLAHERYLARQAGLPDPPIRPGFPGSIDNLWKVRPDGSLIQSLAPPPLNYPLTDYFWSMSPGEETNQIRLVYRSDFKPNWIDVLDVQDFRVLSSQETW